MKETRWIFGMFNCLNKINKMNEKMLDIFLIIYQKGEKSNSFGSFEVMNELPRGNMVLRIQGEASNFLRGVQIFFPHKF